MNPCSLVVTALLAIATVATLAPGQAEAKVISDIHQVSALVPARIWQHIGFVPIRGMDELPPPSIRYRGDVYRGPWVNALASRGTLTESLKEIQHQTRLGYSVSHGAYADRRLTRAEGRHFEVLAEFARDADVLVVNAAHPACKGLTLAQVRAIAGGRTTSWSQVAAAASGAADRIALRHTVINGMFEGRFAVASKPRAAKGRADGGVADAARDASVAAITSWSRVRGRGGVCAVPIDGVAPSNVSVHGLTYKGAYPVSFVAPRKRSRASLPRTRLALYVKFLKSEAAAKLFRGNGLLMKADKPQPETPRGPGGDEGPPRDSQGRPITSRSDNAGALAAMEGERLQRPGGEPGYFRFVFEPGSVVRILDSPDGSSEMCATSSGRWILIEGWRYAENGGGFIAHVRFEFEQATEAFIELPNDPPDVANYDGQQWTRSRSLAGTC